jgi:urease accessory protein
LTPGDALANWQASLRLAFAQRDGITYPTVRQHVGPLRALRGFPAPPGQPDLYEQIIVHPPGGIAAGDRLEIDLNAGQQTNTIFTAPGAAKWYRTVDGAQTAPASQQVSIRVGHRASLEWLPMENIVFDSARAELSMKVVLDTDASFIGADMICLGRPANDETFKTGSLKTRTTISRNEQLIFSEQFVLSGDDLALSARAGLSNASCFANLLIVPDNPGTELLDQLRNEILDELADSAESESIGVTALDQLIIVRWTGQHAEMGWRALRAAWKIARPAINGLAPIEPRIWQC